MRSRPLRSCRLSLESLEGREVPAGGVTTAVSHGNLTITGDKLDNSITITQAAAGSVIITGVGTTVDGGASATKAFTGDLIIKLGAGSDTVSFGLATSIALPKGLFVEYGPKDIGTKITQTTGALPATSLSVAKNVTVKYATGTVTTTLDNLKVTANVSVSHSSGDSTFTADSKAVAGTFASIGGSLTVTNNLGKATNTLADTNVGKNVTFSNGKAVTAAGTTTIANGVNTALATIGGNLSVSNTTGDSATGDKVGDVHVKGNATLSLGGGAFKATVADTTATTAVLVDGNLSVTGSGKGTDTIALGAPVTGLKVTKNLKVGTGSGAATITVDDTAVTGSTAIKAGNGIDTVSIDGAATDKGSTFTGAFSMASGTSADALNINSGSAAAATTDFKGTVSVNLGKGNDSLKLATAGKVNFDVAAKKPVVFDGGPGTNTKTETTPANVGGAHGAPTFKHFA